MAKLTIHFAAVCRAVEEDTGGLYSSIVNFVFEDFDVVATLGGDYTWSMASQQGGIGKQFPIENIFL